MRTLILLASIAAFAATSVGFCPGIAPGAFGRARPASCLRLRMASGGDGGLAEAAAAALKEAEAAEARAAQLKSEVALSKQKRAYDEAAQRTRSPPPVVEEELMDAEELAKEMSAMLNGLQSRGAKETDPLAGTKWALNLDFGREKGTWMDARWGASGARVKRGLAIEFAPDGRLVPVEHPFGLKKTLKGVRGGEWRVEGKFPSEKVKFTVDHDGFTQEESGCDIDLPAGRIFLSANTMGGKLGKVGGMSIEQRRFYVRVERRMVGTYTHSEIAGK